LELIDLGRGPHEEFVMGKRLTLALAVLAVVAVLLGTYAAGYFLLCERQDWYAAGSDTLLKDVPIGPLATIERTYPRQWLAVICRPAGQLEEWLRGTDVEVTYRDPAIDHNHGHP